MSVERYISICGGISNIQRVLAPHDKLIFTVRDNRLVSDSESIVLLENVQGEEQVTFIRPNNIETDELLSIGRLIESQQREHMAPFLPALMCPYRPNWHVSPPQGLLNDPNGFIYHNGEYHLFYQWYPYACEHKDKHWVHLTSSDLINWHWQSVALTPSDWFDSHGVFSGHALSHNGELMLFYTGNVRIGQQRERHTTQCLATSTDGRQFTKRGPVIDAPPLGVTAHIRDPKVLRNQDQWMMLLGAQTAELNGRLAVYRSDDLYQWQFDGLYGDEFGSFGYMWECPDMFELDGQTLVVIGPQGIDSPSKYHNVPHHNGIAKAKWDNDTHFSLTEFEHLDHGFDFYAPQTLLTPDGRRIMCAWMGLPDEIDQPSVESGWLHQLTAMRELTLKQGKLIQWPANEIDRLCQPAQTILLSDKPHRLENNAFDMTIELEWGDKLCLFAGENQRLTLEAQVENRRLVMDRSQTLNRSGDKLRELHLDGDRVQLRILADTSSIEVFVNGGEAVMTSRVFVEPSSTGISLIGVPRIAQIRAINKSTEPFSLPVV